jgi:Dyp-type peroxidase family
MRRRGITRAGLAALFPIVAGHERELGQRVKALPRGERSPFARLECTHFARLVVLPSQRYPAGPGQENLPACLLFSSEFDITPEGYLEALCARMAAEADRIFGHCNGYPGVSTPPRFQRWVLDHRVKAGFSIHGNADAEVGRIRRSLALRKRLIAFAVTTRDDAPPALLQRWRSETWDAPPPGTVAHRPQPLERVPVPTRSHGATAVRQNDLQGNILCGYGRGFGHGLYLFARVEKHEAARAWIAGQVPSIRTAVPWRHPPADTLNLAFTFEGLRALRVDEQVLATFPVEFREGMEKRAARLGDVGDSHPRCWEKGLAGAHVLVSVMAGSAAARDQRLDELRQSLSEGGFSVDMRHQKTAFTGEHEPFGFRDGISQPPIRDPKAGPERRDGDGEPIRPGEFVLGYEDEGGCLPPEPNELGANGSYMVVRKLEQDVAGFWKFIAEQAGPDRGRQEWLAAKIVGRWRDGTPMALSPDLPGVLGADRGKLNAFGYADDGRGLRCPIGAHVRRTNPRDALDRDGDLSRRHRIIRRGMPIDDEDASGLMFVCFQASIERQFEFVQALWCGDGNAFGLGDEPDLIAGPRRPGGKMTVQGIPPTLVPLKRFVTTRGGDYFFAPGIAALRRIGDAPGHPRRPRPSSSIDGGRRPTRADPGG